MSQCTDVDKALSDLEKKIDAQNKEIARLNKLQQQCCNSKSGNGDNNSDLEARVRKLEKEVAALKIGAIECLKAFADIENTNIESAKAFQEFYQMVLPIIDIVSMMTNTLGGFN